MVLAGVDLQVGNRLSILRLNFAHCRAHLIAGELTVRVVYENDEHLPFRIGSCGSSVISLCERTSGKKEAKQKQKRSEIQDDEPQQSSAIIPVNLIH